MSSGRRANLARISALAIPVLSACAVERGSCDVTSARAALTNGASGAEYLKLEPREEAAVVQVFVRSPDPALDEICSGVLIDAQTVLTAKHCAHGLEPTSVTVSFEGGSSGRRLEASAVVSGAHSELDLMALLLEQNVAPDIEVVPLPLASVLPSGLAEGSLVQLAGFGFDASGPSTHRAFLVAELHAIGERELVVSADGLGGACSGDSGGPLLVRDDEGAVRTLAVLASGSTSCFGEDRYTRVDGAFDWLAQVAAIGARDPVGPAGSHDRLGFDGQCFDNRAIWFEAGNLSATVCAVDLPCGWSPDLRGYRCLAAVDDPCHGVDGVGSCRDGAAVRCARGTLETNPCSECGFGCRRSPMTGNPICLAEAE